VFRAKRRVHEHRVEAFVEVRVRLVAQFGNVAEEEFRVCDFEVVEVLFADAERVAVDVAAENAARAQNRATHG